MLAGLGGILQGAPGQLHRLLGQMHHALRIDLLDAPDIGGVAGTKELMGRSLAPAIEAPLMVAHEVLACQHWVLLDPDNRLREVQANVFEDRRIVATVGIAAPKVEGPPRLELTRDVAKPSVQEAV